MTTADRTREHRYGLVSPCRNCPFRTDVEPYLRHDRAVEIVLGLRQGGEFACHKTTVRCDDDGDDTLVDDPGTSRVCAGALGIMLREGQLNQMARISARLGLFDPARIDAAALPVYDSFDEWIAAHDAEPVPTLTDPATGETRELEHCGVVDDDCEDPAGYAVGGSPMDNPEPPTCDPWECCEGCGQTACESCRSPQWDADGRFCTYCYNPDADDEE